MTSAKESVALVRSELRRRSQILGTQVISQGSAMRLGVVSQVWADLDQRQVVVLSVREQALTGAPLHMEIGQAAALGPDAILVTNEEVFEDLDLEGLSKVIGCEVVTETGTRLGKIKDFEFNPNSGAITNFVLSSLGIPLLPGFLVSTYQMSADEVVNFSLDRILVEDGAETRLVSLAKGILERVGIGKPPWEQEGAATPALPSAAQSLRDEDEEYDQDYEEEYDDEVFAPEDEAEEPTPPRPTTEPDYSQEYTAAEDASPEDPKPE